MTTALLVIDVQKIYTDSDSEMYCQDSEATVERINSLVARFEANDLPIVFVRHIHKADGSDLGRMFDYLGEAEEDFNFKEDTNEVEFDERLSQPANAHHLTKTRYSAFANTKLQSLLAEIGVNRIVVCGFMTNFCCESTARGGHDRDYFVDFVKDATGTPGTETLAEEELRTIVGELLEEGFARVLDTEEALTIEY